jgi:hypothetical protein
MCLLPGIGAPEEYIGFVVMGGAMTAFWLNVLWSMSSQLYWEKEQGNLSLFIMAPNSLMAILSEWPGGCWRLYRAPPPSWYRDLVVQVDFRSAVTDLAIVFPARSRHTEWA